MKKNKLKSLFLIILFSLSFLTHFYFSNYPREVVFDEVHFGNFSSSYFTGEYFFDIHPPLGKLLIALGGKIGGYSDYVEKYGDFDFSSIGNNYDKMPFFWFRLFPMLAGLFLPLIVFLLLRAIKLTSFSAFLISLLIIFDNALTIQSKFILIDSLMIFFGFLGLFVFFKSRNKNYNVALIIGAGIFLGASLSVKWTGLSFVFLTLAILAWDLFLIVFKTNNPLRKVGKNILIMFLLFASVGIFYLGTFYVHFKFLPKSGPGDVFMSKEFRMGKLNFWQKFLELNKQIYVSNTGLIATHPDQSTPIQWIMLKKPVHYWTKNESKGFAQITFFGNPIIWLTGIFGVLYFPVFWNKIKLATETKIMLYSGFWINFLPFLFINRPIFLYHYLNAFIFSLILFVLVFFQLEEKNKKLFWSLLSLFIFLVVLGFIVFSPYTYGLALEEDDWKKIVANFFMY